MKNFNQGGPPPLPPHQHHHHPSHAQAHTHPPLHDENGFITNDPNDESATSDLATSYLAYRYRYFLRAKPAGRRRKYLGAEGAVFQLSFLTVTTMHGFLKLTRKIAKWTRPSSEPRMR